MCRSAATAAAASPRWNSSGGDAVEAAATEAAAIGVGIGIVVAREVEALLPLEETSDDDDDDGKSDNVDTSDDANDDDDEQKERKRSQKLPLFENRRVSIRCANLFSILSVGERSR